MDSKLKQHKWKIVTLAVFVLIVAGFFVTKFEKKQVVNHNLQVAMEKERVNLHYIFGERNQYVAFQYDNSPQYTNSEDIYPKWTMVGRNYIASFYYDIGNNQFFLVTFDIEKNFKKEIIDLAPHLTKRKEFKKISDISASLEVVDGVDYVFLTTDEWSSTSKYQYAYNLMTREFQKGQPAQESSSETTFDQDMMTALEENSNFETLAEEKLGFQGGYQIRLDQTIKIGLSTNYFDLNLRLLSDYPELTKIYQDSYSFDSPYELYIISRRGEKGAFPKEPSPPKEPEKEIYPKKEKKWTIKEYLSGKTNFNGLFEGAATSYLAVWWHNYQVEKEYQDEVKEIDETHKKARLAYDKAHEKYLTKLREYKELKDSSYEKQTQLYYSQAEHIQDIFEWFAPEGAESLELTMTNNVGETTVVASYEEFLKWYQENKDKLKPLPE